MSQNYWSLYLNNTVTAAGITLDLSRLVVSDAYVDAHRGEVQATLQAMRDLLAGQKVNEDEGRMVGHYWLRAPETAPQKDVRASTIEGVVSELKTFARDVRGGEIKTQKGQRFQNVLLIGIGGSALGPQLVSEALAPTEPDAEGLRLFFFDNTDPDGFDRTLAAIQAHGGLERTLVVVVSKSGGTVETRNGMLEAQEAFRREGLDFADHAVAVTCQESGLDALATTEGWRRRFPMWDWVGGRTSELSAVGLLPALLEGIDVDAMLRGARDMDRATAPDVELRRNPSLLLALAWHVATGGEGKKDMVIIPYKDRLVLLSRYLQQLIMESLGKELDLDKNRVEQGIAVYGNKGSTDQHSYVQQLRDGVHNFFVTFIEVLKDRDRRDPTTVRKGGVTSGDYLLGFLLGTRQALAEKERQSITLTLDEVSPYTMGALIALYERAVGYYAGLVHINAYHQPGVQAGKIAAEVVVHVQLEALKRLPPAGAMGKTVEEIAVDIPDPIIDKKLVPIDPTWRPEIVYKVLEHLIANDRGVLRVAGATPAENRYSRN